MAQSDITPSSRISVALLGGILVVLTGTSWQAAKWASTIEYSMQAMSVRVAGMETSLNLTLGTAWSQKDMAQWVERLREMNPELKTPAVLNNQ